MQLDTLVAPDLIFPELPAFDVSSVLRAFSDRVVAAGRLDDAEALYNALWEREQLASTGIGQSVAVPHCKLDGLGQVLLAVGYVSKGIEFGAVDGAPVKLFFLVVSPTSQPAAHLQCLAAISKWVQKSGKVDALLGTDDPTAIHQLLGAGQAG